MTARLHIAHILPSFEWGGTQALIVQFAAEARALGVDVTVVSLDANRPTPYAQQLRDLGANVLFVEARYALSPTRLIRLARLVRRNGIDLIHAHLTKPNTVAPLVGRIAQRPVVVGLHTLPNTSTLRSRVRTLIEAFAVKRAASAISCAESIAQAEQKRFAPTNIRIISNPAPAPEHLDRTRTPELPLRFISVGRLSPEKGYDAMLDAAALLRARGLPFRLTIVGEGVLREMLEAKIRQSNLSDCVSLTGARDDVPDLLQDADVFVSSSTFEGLSVAMLEAMGFGLPVVATDVGDTAEVVSDATGALIPADSPTDLADAMAAFITDPSRIAQCGAAAHRLIKETRSPRNWAQSYIDIYRATLARFGGQAA